jgi:nucleoside-diphosphate-sugar epimerase
MISPWWRRVLVTGASGFLGRHLVASLQRHGCEVIGASRSTGFDVTSDSLPLRRVDYVFHLAALTGVPASWHDPVGFHRVNAHGTVRVLEQCRQAQLPLTYVSAYVYGRPHTLPISENAPIQANNPYAYSKFAAEEACRFFAAHCDLNVTVLRPFNIYGPGQDARFLIPSIAQQAIDPTRSRIELQDLAPRRDYVYVDDVVNAIEVVARSGITGTFNVGSGESHSVADVVEILRRIAGTDKPVVSAKCRRPNEIDDVRADIGAIVAAVGWRPAITIEEGLRRIVGDLRSR